MVVEVLVVGQLKTNCYLFYDQSSRKSFIIDPGDDADFIIRRIQDLALQPQAILTTHGHFDHVLATVELKLAFNIPFYLNQDDLPILKRTQSTAKFFLGVDVDVPPQVDGDLVNGKELSLGKLNLKVIKTPGHTPGGVCFYCQDKSLIFVGDLIFSSGSYGRTDLSGGDFSLLKKSIKKVLKLPSKTIIYPGHGDKTTISIERQYWQ